MNIILGLSIFVSTIATGVAYFNFKKNQQLRKELVEKTNRLTESDERYHVLVENVTDGILVVQNNQFKLTNQKILDIIGVPENDVKPIDLMGYIHPADLVKIEDKYRTNMGEIPRPFNDRIRILRNNDSVAWVQVRSLPISWQDQPASLTFVTDITRQKIIETQLQQAQRMEAIGTLAGGIAHDFNNILATITGNAELAMMDMDENSTGMREFKQILQSGYRATELVRQILTISRVNSQETAPVFPGSIIKEALKLIRSTFPSSIRIKETISNGGSKIKADPTKIHQVVLNLCTNARQAMEKSDTGVLEVTLSTVEVSQKISDPFMVLEPGSYFELKVSDTGEGIDPSIIGKIFDPYFSTRPQETGSGLGLATTMGIVKNGGGQITVKSELHKGTVFTVYLPIFEEEIEERQMHPDEESLMKGEGKILFVDDEAEILVIGERMFKNLGYSVITARSGKEALEIFSRAPQLFDILVTDMAMPGMTGARLTREITNIRPGFPVIMCTGYSETINKETAMSMGVRAYIAKPYKLKDLAISVSNHIHMEESVPVASSFS